MKIALLGILLPLLSPSASPAFGTESLPAVGGTGWHKVLVCDHGAAVLDNVSAFGRGGPGVAAQLVIHDPRIVSYFQENGAEGEFVDGQWIGKSYLEPTPGGDPELALLSFRAGSVTVKSDGQSLTVTTGGANWTFRNCARQ
jgi:hypothetical protein